MKAVLKFDLENESDAAAFADAQNSTAYYNALIDIKDLIEDSGDDDLTSQADEILEAYGIEEHFTDEPTDEAKDDSEEDESEGDEEESEEDSKE